MRVEREHMMLYLAKENLYITSMSFLRVNGRNTMPEHLRTLRDLLNC